MKQSIQSGHRWGDWELDCRTLTLNCLSGKYYVDLEQMRSTGSMLDWIFQVRGKSWAKPEILADLLRALRDLFDPQRTLCPGGANLYIDAHAHLERMRLERVSDDWTPDAA